MCRSELARIASLAAKSHVYGWTKAINFAINTATLVLPINRTRKILRSNTVDLVHEQDIFEAVCLDVAERVDSDLVSIWFCSFEGTGILCKCRYDAITGIFSEGQRVMKEDCPRYFETIIEYNYISAPDARTHSATRELTEKYLKPNGVLSLLDFILHEDFKPIGVICCENRRSVRNWSDKDMSYLRSIATLVSSRFEFV